jgi:uncharacterized protein (TIGR02145 family)
MKYLLFVLVILCALTSNAQNHLISFAGTGGSTTIDSVKVENLTSGTTLKLIGSDILRLTGTTGINLIKNKQSSELKIYPNPMTDNSTVEFSSPVTGDALITVHDITGKLVAQNQSYLVIGQQSFRLSGLKSGFYLVSVKGISYQYSGKLLCNGNSGGTVIIEQSNNRAANVKSEKEEKSDSKGIQTTVDMAYTIGDRLKFIGISGTYSTVKTDIPTENKTISFNFIACTDADNNNYAIVQIDTQIWMAENLKTTKYNDGSSIPLVTINAEWASLVTPAYCWYNNDEATYKATYGALYNGYTVDPVNSKKVCPTGWHVPGTNEWNTLTTFLGGNSIAGGKLKETGLSKWFSPNAGATNETGFTGLPGSARSSDGTFSISIGGIGFWWTSVQYGPGGGYYRDMWSNVPNVSYITDHTAQVCGFSVRCIKD